MVKVVPFVGRDAGGQSPSGRSVPLAVLDIGSSKISCLIGLHRGPRQNRASAAQSQLKVIGLGQTAARGVKSGAVVDIREAECAIRLAVDAAERSAGLSISAVTVAVSGGRPNTGTYTGRATADHGVITQQVVDAAVSQAVKAATPGARQVLHLHALDHCLDGVVGIDDPVGLNGQDLTTELAVTTLDAAYLRNLSAAIQNAHLGQNGMVISGLAAARAGMTDDEQELGCVAIDIGAQVTSLAFIRKGQVVAADSIALGGEHITRDVAHGLATSIAHAERMKTLYGTALVGGHGEHDILVVPILGERGADALQRVTKGYLNGILRARLEEILEHCAKRLASPAFVAASAARVVMTGGTSQISGIADLASEMLARPVRIGQPPAIAGLMDQHRHPGLSVLAGTLIHAAMPDRQYLMPREAREELAMAQVGYPRKLAQWLREAL